jgi:hypothetical protein
MHQVYHICRAIAPVRRSIRDHHDSWCYGGAEPRELLDAARDVMEKRGIPRSLASLWREFIEAWDQSSPDHQAAFLAAESGNAGAHLIDALNAARKSPPVPLLGGVPKAPTSARLMR